MSRCRIPGATTALVFLGLSACGGAPVTVENSGERAAVPVTLRLTEAPDEGGVPTTDVQLVILWPDMAREVVDVGSQVGACRDLLSSERFLVEIECWWGPSQVRLALVQVGNEVRVVRRRVDEARSEAVLTHGLRQPVRLVPFTDMNPDDFEGETALLP